MERQPSVHQSRPSRSYSPSRYRMNQSPILHEREMISMSLEVERRERVLSRIWRAAGVKVARRYSRPAPLITATMMNLREGRWGSEKRFFGAGGFEI